MSDYILNLDIDGPELANDSMATDPATPPTFKREGVVSISAHSSDLATFGRLLRAVADQIDPPKPITRSLDSAYRSEGER